MLSRSPLAEAVVVSKDQAPNSRSQSSRAPELPVKLGNRTRPRVSRGPEGQRFGSLLDVISRNDESLVVSPKIISSFRPFAPPVDCCRVSVHPLCEQS